ncbi:MAG: hypothetical protein JSR98_22000 [Proteobacteria bacterium]|nr:hypothetical protein [Pseudomonadota bacterium]
MADEVGLPARASVGEGVLFSEELGRTICERIAAGQSIMAVCRATGMPHRTSVKRWADRDPGFRAALGEALLARRTARRLADHARAAERSGRRSARGGSVSRYTQEVGEAICARLANGESLVAICGDPDMPCAGTVYGWVARHPAFQDAYVAARMMQADYLLDEAREVALGATPKSVWADRLRFDTIRWMTARLAPKKYCEPVVLARAAAEIRAEEAEARGEGEGLTVIVKRHTDITPEEYAAHDATERAWEARRLGRR